MKILGIDPGTNRLGYAIITDKPLRALNYGLVEIKGQDQEEIYNTIFKKMASLIKKEKPELLVIENLYFSKNQKTALRVAEIRGVIKLLAFQNGLMIYEADPKEIKLCATGYGNADKVAVAKMISKIFKIEEKLIDDVTDAIATAYCGINYKLRA